MDVKASSPSNKRSREKNRINKNTHLLNFLWALVHFMSVLNNDTDKIKINKWNWNIFNQITLKALLSVIDRDMIVQNSSEQQKTQKIVITRWNIKFLCCHCLSLAYATHISSLPFRRCCSNIIQQHNNNQLTIDDDDKKTTSEENINIIRKASKFLCFSFIFVFFSLLYSINYFSMV